MFRYCHLVVLMIMISFSQGKIVIAQHHASKQPHHTIISDKKNTDNNSTTNKTENIQAGYSVLDLENNTIHSNATNTDKTCGDGNCSDVENCQTCPEDCRGCGDHCCRGFENPCSCPEDCTEIVCGDGCLSESEDCNQCPNDCPQLFSIHIPGLIGPYSCAWGLCTRESTFDFGQYFLSIDDAWIVVRGTAVDFCGVSSFTLYSILDEIRSNETRTFDTQGYFAVGVPINSTKNLLHGKGTIGLHVSTITQYCFDAGSNITDVTFWLAASPAPRTRDLVDFADFQLCFHQEYDINVTVCTGFDYNNDRIIDIDDYIYFQMILDGP